MQEKFAARNTLHTAMIEQAAFDRNLYQSNNGSTSINLRFPEYITAPPLFPMMRGHNAKI
jgi:hypothetical protein